jgi:hypothetical protein
VTGGAREPDDLAAFFDTRLPRYVDLWQSASAKLSTGSYHAEDLVDDWFSWVGLVARDAMATATLILREASAPDGEDPPPDSG